MKLRPFPALAGLSVLLLSTAADAENWSGFRGPRGDGTSLERAPIRWGATRNVLWKTRVPGRGHASPVVWKDRVYLVSAVEETGERLLIALDATSGRVAWQRTVLRAPLEEIHPFNSRASSTPLADADAIYVSFLDRDRMFVAAYDHDGRQLWAARPGVFASKHGYSSSPVPFGDLVIVNGDHDGEGYLVALERKSGRIRWKTPRPNNTRSYCTPIIRRVSGRPLLMLSGSKCVAAYDPATGRQVWIMDGPTEQFVASPVFDGNLLFITSGYPDRHIVAVRADGQGRIGEERIAWRTRRGCAYVPAPVVVNGYFVIVSDGGFASCFAARDGTLHWTERLGAGHTASLLTTADGLVYFVSDRGVTTVVRPGKTFDRVAVNELGEDVFASPAVSGGRLYLRGVEHLYAIGTTAPAASARGIRR